MPKAAPVTQSFAPPDDPVLGKILRRAGSKVIL